jgi:hypothetical protein
MDGRLIICDPKRLAWMGGMWMDAHPEGNSQVKFSANPLKGAEVEGGWLGGWAAGRVDEHIHFPK